MIPVYLFTGFLESGKTSVILETLQDPNFNDGEKTLILAAEEGEIEYDPALMEKCNAWVIPMEVETMTLENLEDLDNRLQPERIMIEFNGMSSVTAFLQQPFPSNWEIAEIFTAINAQTFGLYVTNMRTLLYEQLVYSDTVLFNRCDETTRQSYLRSNIKAINRRAQIIYEDKNRNLSEIQEEELPFNLNADIIEIQPNDYGLFYLDAFEHPHKYEGKHISFQGMIHKTDPVSDNHFIIGRKAMVCCADDTSLIGFLARYKQAGQLKEGQWVDVRAQVVCGYDPHIQDDVPALVITNLEFIEPFEEDLVYFS